MSELPAFLRDAPAPALRVPVAPRAARRVPGEAGIWVFILGDMLMFGFFFAAFMVQRGQDPELFAQARETMTVAFGAVNTLVLLTSSLFVATAVRAHRGGRRADARRLVALAGACAAVFAAIKIAEWGIKLDAGYAPGDNLFYTYYYVLTGVHFLHLTIGSVVLAFWWRAPAPAAATHRRAPRRRVLRLLLAHGRPAVGRALPRPLPVGDMRNTRRLGGAGRRHRRLVDPRRRPLGHRRGARASPSSRSATSGSSSWSSATPPAPLRAAFEAWVLLVGGTVVALYLAA